MIELMLLLILGVWIITIRFDKARVREQLQQRGGLVTSISFRMFGRGWATDYYNRRNYEIRYFDRHGNFRHAWGKIGRKMNVYLYEDHILSPAKRAQ
jgi:hypothetical protein